MLDALLRLAEVAPFVCILALVARWGVDVPYYDEWDMASLLQGHEHGTLHLADFWALHNEHRPIVARVLLFGLALVTRWNVRAELFVGVALALVYYLVVRRRLRAAGATPAALVVASLLTFSITQHENWFWGWQVEVFANLIAATATFALLARGPVSVARAIAAAVLGATAAASFANGLLVLPIGFVALLASRPIPVRSLVAFGAVALAFIVTYLVGWHATAAHPPLTTILQHPVGAVAYPLAFLGAPYCPLRPDRAVVAGAIVVAATVWCWRAARTEAAGTRRFAAMLIAYAALSAGMISVGRIGFGIVQATSSRYISFSTLLPLGLLCLCGRARGRGLVLALGLAGLYAYGQAFPIARATEQQRASQRVAFIADDDEGMRPLFPVLEPLKAWRAWARASHLTCFRATSEQTSSQ